MVGAPVSILFTITIIIAVVRPAAIRRIGLDVGEIEQHHLIILHILADHVVISSQGAAGCSAVGVPGVIYKAHAEVLGFELRYHIQVIWICVSLLDDACPHQVHNEKLNQPVFATLRVCVMPSQLSQYISGVM